MALWTSRQVAEYLVVSERHLARLRRAGTGPRYVRAGKNKDVRYPPEEVESWVAAGLVSSTSEEPDLSRPVRKPKAPVGDEGDELTV
jgi:hypothetical protein